MSRVTPNVTFHLHCHFHHFPSHAYLFVSSLSRFFALGGILCPLQLGNFLEIFGKFCFARNFLCPPFQQFLAIFGSFLFARNFLCPLISQFLAILGGSRFARNFCALLFSAIFGNFWRFRFRAQFFVPSSHLLPLLMSAVTPFSLSFPKSRFW